MKKTKKKAADKAAFFFVRPMEYASIILKIKGNNVIMWVWYVKCKCRQK